MPPPVLGKLANRLGRSALGSGEENRISNLSAFQLRLYFLPDLRTAAGRGLRIYQKRIFCNAAPTLSYLRKGRLSN